MSLGSTLSFATVRSLAEFKPRRIAKLAWGKRHIRVAQLVAIGFGNKQIAATLGLSGGTAKVYVAQLFQLGGFGSRTEVARWVWESQAENELCLKSARAAANELKELGVAA